MTEKILTVENLQVTIQSMLVGAALIEGKAMFIQGVLLNTPHDKRDEALEVAERAWEVTYKKKIELKYKDIDKAVKVGNDNV